MTDRSTRLLDLFLAEARESIAILARGAMAIGSTSADVGELFRAAHTIKGGARMLGLDAVAAAAERVESVFQRIREMPVEVDAERELAIAAIDALAGILFSAPDADGPRKGLSTGIVPVESAAVRRTTIRVTSDRVDRVVALVGEVRRMATAADPSSDPDGLLVALEQAALRLRLIPLSTVFDDLRRSILDGARANEKAVAVETTGGDIELDASVADVAAEVVLQLARNAVAHGIEPPDQRVRSGKTPVGTVRISAALAGGHVAIVVADDGGGVDAERVRHRARLAGLDDSLPLLDLICAPGLSTRERVDNMAGLGVGMDIVRERVARADGDLDLDTSPSGTEFRVRLPISRVFESLTIARIGGRLIGIPRDRVARVTSTPEVGSIAVDSRVDEAQALTAPLGPLLAPNRLAKRAWIAPDGEVGIVLELSDHDDPHQ